VAALGVVMVARFDAALDAKLAAMGLPDSVVQTVTGQRSRLAAADLSTIADAGVRESIHHALEAAYAAGFRTLALVCSALAALGAVAAFALVGREARR
jgi:hypothetical protein